MITATPILFCDRGCPFAQRVLALADHLSAPLDRREAPVGEKPEGLDRYSSSGAIPLLVHGDLVITESRVMLEHLAEHFAFTDAYPLDLRTRTNHRYAMALVDEHLAPALMRGRITRHLEEVLDALERILGEEPHACLATFHVAPLLSRFAPWRPDAETTRAIEERPAIRRWLSAALQIPSLSRTTPDPELHACLIESAREAGLIQPG